MMLILGGEAVEVHELAIVRENSLETAQKLAAGPEGTALFGAYSLPLLEGLSKFLETPLSAEVHLRAGLVGATAWMRQLRTGADRAASEHFLTKLVDVLEETLSHSRHTVRVRWELIEASSEARYELKAVEYAVMASHLPQPLATFAGGSGSVQITGL